MDKTYKIKARCDNCNWRSPGNLVIMVGLPLKNLACPNCGTLSLKRG